MFQYDFSILLSNGADINARDNTGYTPLNLARTRRDVEGNAIVASLEECGEICGTPNERVGCAIS
jgi:hypothetical protein